MKLLMFSTDFCTACRQVKPMIKQVCEERRIELIEIEATTSPDLEKYKIRSVPTVIVLDDEGKELNRFSGYISKSQILEGL